MLGQRRGGRLVRVQLWGLLPRGGPARLRTVRVTTGQATASIPGQGACVPSGD